MFSPLPQLVLTGLIAAAVALPATALAEPDADETATVSSEHDDAKPMSRVDRLVDRARNEDWDPDQLFSHLELDDDERCRLFTDRAHLRERHARWSEAVELLHRIDPKALENWLFGVEEPPRLAVRETKRQLRCMLDDLIDASRKPSSDIRLFLNIHHHFGGRFSSAADLADAIDDNPRWLDHAVQALSRSMVRDLNTQAYIWYRKFTFTGRSFNRISDHAAQYCSLVAGHTWRPENERHRRCWQNHLSPSLREQEILTASAAPGLSRHHWGTDVDILGLNPVHFVSGGALHDDWRWLDDYGLDYGFFQSFRDLDDHRHGHMEERWHWSYYPIAQALWEFAHRHQEWVEGVLFDHWERLERRWGRGRGPFFDHMRDHWRDYLFNIDVPAVDAEHSPDGAPSPHFEPLP